MIGISGLRFHLIDKRVFGAGADPVSPVLSEKVGLSTTAQYLPGISEVRSSASTYYHSGIKNAFAQTAANESVSASKRYDAFGNELSTSGTWKGNYKYGGPFGYQKDTDSSLQLLGNRYYDPELGRFLTRDVAKDGRNWYTYCSNNPLQKADPAGLAQIVLLWYHVFGGGFHTGIIIVEEGKNKRKPVYSIADGPEFYRNKEGDDENGYGKAVSRSGPWESGTQDYDKLKGKWNGRGWLLFDHNKPAKYWINKFTRIEKEMTSGTSAKYSPVPASWGDTADSNSWTKELLDRSGLILNYHKAQTKYGLHPWAPGWGKDVWS